jgi:hypothetical protein
VPARCFELDWRYRPLHLVRATSLSTTLPDPNTGNHALINRSAIPQGQTSAAALVTFAEGVTGNSYTWNVNLAQGTAINVRITDSTGAIAYSSGLTVQAGSSGCLSGASASASSAVTSAVPASSGAATAAPSASQTS